HYVHRGADSRALIARLLALDQSRVRFVRGNHDDIFDQVINAASYAGPGSGGENDRAATFRWFMQHGLDATFLSYGARLRDLKSLERHWARKEVDAISNLVPPRHHDFIRTLPSAVDGVG